MLFKMVTIGEIRGWAKAAYDDYEKRLSTPYSLKTVQIPTPKRAKNQSAQKCMAVEAKKIIAALDPQDTLVCLDQHGLKLSTEQFHQRIQNNPTPSLAFVIGGPDGLCPSIKQKANWTLSLSAMVLPHALARVMLVEQLYRSYSLFHQHPYHRP